MNQTTIKFIEALSQLETTKIITAAWYEVLKEIGNTNSDTEIVASVIAAMLRSGKGDMTFTG